MPVSRRCVVPLPFDMTLNHLPAQTHSPGAAQGTLPSCSCFMKIKSPITWLKAQPLQEVVSVCLLSTAGQGSFPAASTDTPCPSQFPHRSTTTVGSSRTCSLPIHTPLPGKCWGWDEGICKQTALYFALCTCINFPVCWALPLAVGSQVGVFWGVFCGGVEIYLLAL